ncbi:retention module-containing protein, partial [Thiomicrorhabdus sp.]|uniref:retention module-containing protein n=1 Tax=Thiomicrorhabdus sp. TaxID=2039724 RepID=UPI003561345E
MSIVAGKVSAVTGVVQAINPNTGEIRLLSQGDQIFSGEVILTSVTGGITIDLNNGELLTLGRDTEMLMDEDVTGASVTDSATENAVDVAALQQAILEGNVDLENLEETAAGDAGAGSSANAGGENLVDRLGATGSVTSGFDTSGISPTITNRGFQAEAAVEPAVAQPVNALVSISGAQDIVEGDASTPYTVSVDQAAGDVTGDITVELIYSGTAIDGTDYTGVAQVTIPAGNNSVDFTINTIDDALAEGVENFTITIGNIVDTANSFDTIAADTNANSVLSTISDENPEDPNNPQDPDTAFTLKLFAADAQGNIISDPSVINEEGETSTYYVV